MTNPTTRLAAVLHGRGLEDADAIAIIACEYLSVLMLERFGGHSATAEWLQTAADLHRERSA